MEVQGRFTLHDSKQSGKRKPSEQAKLPPRKRNDLSEIVTDKKQLWIKSTINLLVQALRNAELEELKRKYLS
jgi:hypothetical protein